MQFDIFPNGTIYLIIRFWHCCVCESGHARVVRMYHNNIYFTRTVVRYHKDYRHRSCDPVTHTAVCTMSYARSRWNVYCKARGHAHLIIIIMKFILHNDFPRASAAAWSLPHREFYVTIPRFEYQGCIGSLLGWCINA